MRNISKKVFYLIFIFLFLSNYLAFAEQKIKIELQIGNEILTNLDFILEQNYLIALNNNLKDIPKNQLKEIAIDSLIREKIKKNELLKFYNFDKSEKYMDRLIEDFYKRLNFSNKNDFVLYLKSYNLDILEIKEKLKIETLWNELIFKKFNNQINIDEEEIKRKIKNKKNIIIEYNLSEILFELKSNETISYKYDLILKNIKNTGFKNSANIFSISESSKFGGDIGWINDTQLNEILFKEIKLLKVNDITKPIQTINGYLIIKLNEKREKKKEIDFDKAFKHMIVKEKNRQLNQFSLIYYNKIKHNIYIDEK
tara:strand:+ start:4586 stop:5521 length:936 start_codon:yes stop_codon:yes gene_type:complete